MTDMLLGTVENGRRAMLQSITYTGEVGVRDRGDGQIELAWFGRQPSFRGAVTATLDDAAVTITSLSVRDLAPNQQGGALKSVIATAVLSPVPAPDPAP